VPFSPKFAGYNKGMVYMTNEMKQAFTMRITKANRTQLVVIVYDMFLVYIDDAKEAKKINDMHEFARNLDLARNCLADLRKNLNFEYELSKTLHSIYMYCDRQLAGDIFSGKTDNLKLVCDMIKKLRDAFEELSLTDKSEPLMENTQEVYVGLTYGKKELNETLVNPDLTRGFTV
jgi:flagellar protein FliS